MEGRWYIQRDGERFGPYNMLQLKQMTTTGQLLPVDFLLAADASEPVPAGSVPGLFSLGEKDEAQITRPGAPKA